jgi:hypothetical protein
VGALNYTVGAGHDVAYVYTPDCRCVRHDPSKHSDLASLEREGHIRYVRFYPVTITGTTPALAGWTFTATLQHIAAEGEVINLLRAVPGLTIDLPHRFRTATPETCEHCNKTIRTRKETFVVAHEDGTWKQVGRNCLADFLGGQDPHAVARALELLLSAHDAASTDEDEDGFGGGGGGYVRRHGLRTFLATVAMLIRTEGWMSRGRARQLDAVCATADAALYYLTPPKPGTEAYADWGKFVATHPIAAEDTTTADSAYTFARDTLCDRTDRSDYEHNLYVATIQETIDAKLAGIAASLVPYFIRDIERKALREAEAKAVGDSKFFGEVGKRSKGLIVTLLRERTIEGAYGTTWIYKFVTADGNACTWFASKNQQLKTGAEYMIDATVKAHKTYQGVAETALTRCTVYTDEGRRQAEEKAAKRAARARRKVA